MPATRTEQTQGGSDSSESTRQPTHVLSSRREDAKIIVSRTENDTEVSQSVTSGTTSQTKTTERIGCTLTFEITVTGNPVPKALDS